MGPPSAPPGRAGVQLVDLGPDPIVQTTQPALAAFPAPRARHAKRQVQFVERVPRERPREPFRKTGTDVLIRFRRLDPVVERQDPRVLEGVLPAPNRSAQIDGWPYARRFRIGDDRSLGSSGSLDLTEDRVAAFALSVRDHHVLVRLNLATRSRAAHPFQAHKARRPVHRLQPPARAPAHAGRRPRVPPLRVGPPRRRRRRVRQPPAGQLPQSLEGQRARAPGDPGQVRPQLFESVVLHGMSVAAPVSVADIIDAAGDPFKHAHSDRRFRFLPVASRTLPGSQPAARPPTAPQTAT